MTGHTVVVEREGRSFELWRPGDTGVHDRVEFLDESDVVRMVCTCGLVFDAVEDAWEHLDAVAESRWTVSDPGPGTMKLERDVGGVVSVLVDVFHEELWRFGSSSSLLNGVKQLDAPLAMELWTAEELLEEVKDVVSPPEEVTYDVVCYRADANRTDKVGETWELESGTAVVRVSPSEVVAEVVPDDRPVRVTDSFYAPYVFEDESD